MAYAISRQLIDFMQGNIGAAYEKHIGVSSCALTYEQALNLCAPPQHVDYLIMAAEIAAVSQSTWLTFDAPVTLDGVDTPIIQLDFMCKPYKTTPLLPKNPHWYGDDKRNAEVRQPVLNHVEHVLKTRRMYSTCLHVLDTLNMNCTDGFQVRSLWPAVQFLCNRDPDREAHGYLERATAAAAWREKHNKPKVHRHMPYVDPSFRKLLQETSEWLTLASLLEAPKNDTSPEVVVTTYASSSFRCYEMNGAAIVLSRRVP